MGRSKLELVLGSRQVLVRSKLELEQVRSKVLELELVRSKRLVQVLVRSKLVLELARSKQVLVLRSKLGQVRSSCSS